MIPIVFVIVSDPIAPGFVPGVRRGGQITGQDVARRLISGRSSFRRWSAALVDRTNNADVVITFGTSPLMFSRIEDYALIGDCETAALVSKDGSIDWLCWPRFDSGACFAALLGDANNGRWRIAPATAGMDTSVQVSRRYRGDTLILEAEFRYRRRRGRSARLHAGARRPGLVPSRASGGRQVRHCADAQRIDRPVRARRLRAVGNPQRDRRSPRDCGPGYAAPAHAHRDSGRGADHDRRLRCVSRAAGAVRSHLCPVPLAPSRARRRAAIHGRILGVVGEHLPGPRTAGRDHHALADHVEGSDLCADWGHHRRADDLAARATGRPGTTASVGCATRR